MAKEETGLLLATDQFSLWHENGWKIEIGMEIEIEIVAVVEMVLVENLLSTGACVGLLLSKVRCGGFNNCDDGVSNGDCCCSNAAMKLLFEFY